MAANSFKVCSAFGIPVRISYSWLPVFGLILFLMGSSFYPRYFPNLPASAIWITAATATILYFLSLLAHELGHALAARALGIHVQSVELFAFGGVARMIGYSRRPRDEFAVAAAGPLVTLALTLLFWAVYLVLDRWLAPGSPPARVAEHLRDFNFILLMFNLLPGYPLDGGRVVQGLLWRLTGRRTLSAAIVTVIGLLLAAAIVGLAVYVATSRHTMPMALPSALLLVLLAVFIGRTALKNYSAAQILERVAMMSVAQAVDPQVQTITSAVGLDAAWQAESPDDGPAAVILDAEGRAASTVTGDEDESPDGESGADGVVRAIPPDHRVSEAMPLLDALTAMGNSRSPWLIVEDATGRYVGTLTQSSLRQAFRVG